MGPRTPPSRSGHSETAGRGRRPGERFHYSDLGYQTLGLVIEAVEGRPYPEAVRTRVLEPLRMTATEPAIIHDIRPRLAVGYAYLHDDRIGYPGRSLAPATWVETATADGAIASTAVDIAALARMLLRRGEGPDGRLLSEASFARMAKPHARSMTGYGYGYGLATRVLGGRTFLGHGGGMIGYLSALQVDPAAELAAVILQNGLMGSPMARTRGACQAALTLLPASIVKVSRAEGLRVSGGCGVCDEWPGGANPRCLRQRHPRRGPWAASWRPARPAPLSSSSCATWRHRFGLDIRQRVSRPKVRIRPQRVWGSVKWRSVHRRVGDLHGEVEGQHIATGQWFGEPERACGKPPRMRGRLHGVGGPGRLVIDLHNNVEVVRDQHKVLIS